MKRPCGELSIDVVIHKAQAQCPKFWPKLKMNKVVLIFGTDIPKHPSNRVIFESNQMTLFYCLFYKP